MLEKGGLLRKNNLFLDTHFPNVLKNMSQLGCRATEHIISFYTDVAV